MRAPLVVALVLVGAGCVLPGDPGPGPATTPTRPTEAAAPDALVALAPFLSGLDAPVQLLDLDDGTGRMLVVEQGGLVRLVRDGALLDAPVLDVRDDITHGGEQGLLSVAISPTDPATLFVSTTDRGGDTRLVRYRFEGDRVDPASASVILTHPQPFANHNGGLARFGPDGFLYFGLGDGGAGGDPLNHAQDLDSLLGKLLRLDVSGEGEGYAIPADNPFVGREGRDEIFAYGLRNPWRFAFDRATGDLWIGDVGQNAVEEIDLLPAGQSGTNFGWAAWEGSERYDRRGITGAEAVFPVAEYTHADTDGCSVTGGHVYRGAAIPTLVGTYVYGDYCSGTLWGLAKDPEGAWTAKTLLDTQHRISSFAEDAAGELYVIDHAGAILRLVAP